MSNSDRPKVQAVPFESVLEEHGPGLHAWLVVRVGPDRADDVFQEVMVAALVAWEKARVDSVKAWLYTIAGNKAIDDFRRTGSHAAAEGEVDEWPSSEVTERFEDPIWEQVRALPEKQRAAVTLRFRGDLTHREIGQVMGTSEPAARRNLFEGIKRLRERKDHE